MRGMLKLTCSLVFLFTSAAGFCALNTVPDGSRHAAFGSICIQTAEGEPWACFPAGGLLVAPQIVISIAHACPWLNDVKPVRTGFTFEEKNTSPTRVYEVDQFICDPLFAWDTQDPNDLAVATLKEPVLGIRPFTLPPVVGFLDKGNVAGTYLTLVSRSLWTLDGFPDFLMWGDRRYGTLVITDKTAGGMMLGPDAKHPAQTCYGDSGSAALFTNTNMAVGIGSWFSEWTDFCKGPGGYTRLDTPQARDFLQLYLPPELLPK